MSPGNNLLPYNVTLSSQTASILYKPFRDGNRTTGWNVSYTYGFRDTGYGFPQGIGIDYHTTSCDGATLQFNWTGTAVFLYGNASNASFSITVDDRHAKSFDVPQGGLLGKMQGLEYKEHTAKLTVQGDGKEVAFQYAHVTIGLGFPGSQLKNHTINAVNGISETKMNPFFNYTGPSDGWRVEDLTKTNTSAVDNFPKIFRANGSITNLPRQMITSDKDDIVTFNLNNTSAFFLWGTVNQGHGSKYANLSGPDGFMKQTLLEDNSSVLDFWQVLYWESGLDRDEVYTVSVVNVDHSKFAFSELKIIDSGAHIPRGLDPGVIAAIDIASLSFVALLAVVGLFYWRRHSKANRPPLLHRISIIDLEPLEFAAPPDPAASGSTTSNPSSPRRSKRGSQSPRNSSTTCANSIAQRISTSSGYGDSRSRSGSS